MAASWTTGSRFDPQENEIPPEFLDLNFMAQKAWLARYYDLDQNPFGTVPGRPMKEYLHNQREVNFRQRDVPLSFIGMKLPDAVESPSPPCTSPLFVKFNLKKENYVYVDNGAKFLSMMKILEYQRELYVDVERNNSNCYQKEAVMLIQISVLVGTQVKNYLIDPLSVADCIRDNLKRVFEKPTIYKIFHDVHGDVVSLLGQFQIYTRGIIDSALLHQKLFPDEYAEHEVTKNKMWTKLGLNYLVNKYLGPINEESCGYYSSLKQLLKAANWAIRPIQTTMRHYAVGDSLLMLKVVNEWKKKTGRQHFMEAWNNVHDQINIDLTRPGTKMKFTPIADPSMDASKISRQINWRKGELRRKRRHFTDVQTSEEDIQKILQHRVYLAKVMDEKPETIFHTNDLVQILLLRPSDEDGIRNVMSRKAINYPCINYWATTIIRYFNQGVSVFDDIRRTRCHKCDEYGHPARFCPVYVERGSRFYEKNPEYARIQTTLQNSRRHTNVKFRRVFQEIQIANQSLELNKYLTHVSVQGRHQEFHKFLSAVEAMKTTVDAIVRLGNSLTIDSSKRLNKDEIKGKWTNKVDQFQDEIEVLNGHVRTFPSTFNELRKIFDLSDRTIELKERYWLKLMEPLPVKESKEADRLVYIQEAQVSFTKLKNLCDKSGCWNLMEVVPKLKMSLYTLSFLSRMCSNDRLGPKQGQTARNEKMTEFFNFVQTIPSKVMHLFNAEQANDLRKSYEDVIQYFHHLQGGLLGIYDISPSNPIKIEEVQHTTVFMAKFSDFNVTKFFITSITNSLQHRTDLVQKLVKMEEQIRQAHAFIALLGTISLNAVIINKIVEHTTAAITELNHVKNCVQQMKDNIAAVHTKDKWTKVIDRLENLHTGLVFDQMKDQPGINADFKQTHATTVIQQEWMTETIMNMSLKVQKINQLLQDMAKKQHVSTEEAEMLLQCSREHMYHINCLYVLSYSCSKETRGILTVSIMRMRTAVRAVRQAEILLNEIRKHEGVTSPAADEMEKLLTSLKTYVFFRDILEGARLEEIKYLSGILATEEI